MDIDEAMLGFEPPYHADIDRRLVAPKHRAP
jgi:hypothetical protein